MITANQSAQARYFRYALSTRTRELPATAVNHPFPDPHSPYGPGQEALSAKVMGAEYPGCCDEPSWVLC